MILFSDPSSDVGKLKNGKMAYTRSTEFISLEVQLYPSPAVKGLFSCFGFAVVLAWS